MTSVEDGVPAAEADLPAAAADPAGKTDDAAFDPVAGMATRLADLTVHVKGLRDDFGKVVPHLVGALKRDQGVEALVERLQSAERRLASKSAQPLAMGVVAILHLMRRIDMAEEVTAVVDEQIVALLATHGLTEFGQVGDSYDPGRHEPVGGRVLGGQGTVTTLHATGFQSGPDVVLKAKVTVAPLGGDTQAPPAEASSP